MRLTHSNNNGKIDQGQFARNVINGNAFLCIIHRCSAVISVNREYEDLISYFTLRRMEFALRGNNKA